MPHTLDLNRNFAAPFSSVPSTDAHAGTNASGCPSFPGRLDRIGVPVSCPSLSWWTCNSDRADDVRRASFVDCGHGIRCPSGWSTWPWSVVSANRVTSPLKLKAVLRLASACAQTLRVDRTETVSCLSCREIPAGSLPPYACARPSFRLICPSLPLKARPGIPSPYEFHFFTTVRLAARHRFAANHEHLAAAHSPQQRGA